MGPHGEGNRNREGQDLQDMCSRNDWMIGNNWFQNGRRKYRML
jgi:hypothetical protein